MLGGNFSSHEGNRKGASSWAPLQTGVLTENPCAGFVNLTFIVGIPHMHPYRTHTCAQLRSGHCAQRARLSGWLRGKRDHGALLFLDLADENGVTQCVVEQNSPLFDTLSEVRPESVLTLTGVVVRRTPDTVNAALGTGEIELRVEQASVLSRADVLPLQVGGHEEAGEDRRLRYRFLDLRRPSMQERMRLRSAIIASMRRRMQQQGFLEIQTPILTASAPEGARDFLTPSRLHPGRFYALPQAPQVFKQLLMVSGFDRYFQIAPCFRDEDSRADRSPGEFYQLDFEMSFATQDDVLAVLEPVLEGVFREFSGKRKVSSAPFPRISYQQALARYGTDKPDLRNPLQIVALDESFRNSGFSLFAKAVEKGAVVRGILTPRTAARPRGFFDSLNAWARAQGAGGLGYLIFPPHEGGKAKGPVAKHLGPQRCRQVLELCKGTPGDAVFLVCDTERNATQFAGMVRTHLAEQLDLIEQDAFRFCWVVDLPMYKRDPETNKIVFSHNPFSMPQGGMEALRTQNPEHIKAWQYDTVCNGVELSSGAIRCHVPEIMYKTFSIAGYSRAQVQEQFHALIQAFRYGAPPHGGSAPGIDRIVMMLANQPSIREVIAFPMNQKAQDLLTGAPTPIDEKRLRELHIRTVPPEKCDGTQTPLSKK